MPGFGSFEFVVPDFNLYGAETAPAWKSKGKRSSYSLNSLLLSSGPLSFFLAKPKHVLKLKFTV